MALLSDRWKHVPILLIDIEGFSSRFRRIEERRAMLRQLQDILTDSARFFMPFGDVWSRWHRHGTGDGYYFVFDGIPAPVVLQYTLAIRESLSQYNSKAGGDLPLRIRMVITIGDVEWVDDQLLSEAFTEAERFINYDPFRRHFSMQSDPTAIVISTLFHIELLSDLAQAIQFPKLRDLQWSSVVITDKHGMEWKGYILGSAWEAGPSEAHALPIVRIGILIGHFLEAPLPEAAEMAKAASLDFQNSQLMVDIFVDVASRASLRRLADAGCDLLIYYGHGLEDGHLLFEEGGKTFDHLADTASLLKLWQSLSACLVFACWGDRFAAKLPCPWVAFTARILREAPHGFIHSLVGHLRQHDLARAVRLAQKDCTRHMQSDFAGVMHKSEAPIPALRFNRGNSTFSRLSPSISNSYLTDFASVEDGYLRYPDHDPFVGRLSQLRSLLRIPSQYGDYSLQRVIWVHGSAGLGKSALLRQFAVYARDLLFFQPREPIYLLHLQCYKHTQERAVVDALCRAAAQLYRLNGVPASVDMLMHELEPLSATHVWALDDLTYLSVSPDSTTEAATLANNVSDSARARAINLQLVLSTRRPAPHDNRFESLPVSPLTLPEARELAQAVYRQAGHQISGQDLILGADSIYQRVRGSTGNYKRAILLALSRGLTLQSYAREWEQEGSLEHLDAMQFARRMVEYEVRQITELSARHGFDYRQFLEILYPLISRVSFFTHDELVSWFGNAFCTDSVSKPPNVAYKNGLTYLVRLGLLSVENRPEGVAFGISPSQRLSVLALSNPKVNIPPSVRLRGAKERLSLALELAKAQGVDALSDFISMEEDYRPHLRDPEAAAAVFHSMMVRAEVSWLLSTTDRQRAETLRILDDVTALYDLYKDSYGATGVDASSAAAQALVNKGARLAQLSRTEEAVAVFDQVVARFGKATELALREQVAKALVNKGLSLGRLNRTQEELALCDQVVARFGEATELALREQVAKALFNKGLRLVEFNLIEEGITVYDQVVARFGEATDLVLQEYVAEALLNKGVGLGELDLTEEAIAVYDQVAARFGEATEPALRRSVAGALVNKGARLAQLNRTEEAITVYDQVVARFGDATELALRDLVAGALVNKGARLAQLNRTEEAIAVYDQVVARLGEATELLLREQVAKALVNKGLSLGWLNRTEEAIAVCDQVVARFGEATEPTLRESVARALIQKGASLAGLNRTEEALMTLCAAWRMRTSLPDKGAMVARALEMLGVEPGNCERQPG